MPVRPAPDASSLRADALLAGTLALVGCGMVALTAMTGLQFEDVPIWAPLLAAVLVPAPLVLRRVHPIPVAVVQVVLYIVAGELGVLELYVSQVNLFMGFYSIGAWETHRRRAFWSRLVIVIAMAVWLAISAVRGFFDSGEPCCTSQTVAKMNRKNCRYSDCQFSATSMMKWDELMKSR